MNKTTKVLLALGLGSAFLYATARNSNPYQDKTKPLNEISKESVLFDINPKDSVLSIEESERFIKELLDRDKDGILTPAEIEEIRKIINGFKHEYYLNTYETAKNMQSGLEFVLIRQKNNTAGVTDEFYPKQEREKELSYSDFYRLAFKEEKPLIKKVILQNNSNELTAIFNDNSSNVVRIPSDVTALKDLADKLIGKSIEVNVKEEGNAGWVLQAVLMLAPIGLIVLFMYLVFARNQGFMSSITGNSKVKPGLQDNTKVTFQDVAGIDEVKDELREIVDFLKDPSKYQAIGAKVPKGVLLVGPPGTGKTLLAKAVAGEASVPFFRLSGSDFVEMFVGVGAARVRGLFKEARKHAPCLIFIDEIDAVGRHRGAGLGGGHDEREQTLNQLLVEMSGFDSREGIIVLAATNRPDILDAALLRPGRFDRQVVLGRPDVRGREAILKVHARGKNFSSDVDLKTIARSTAGFTGADLANLLNEAALLAARKNKTEISMSDLEEAIDKVIAGPEKKSMVISPKDKKITAYHEMGHALVAYFEKDADPLHKVTIIPRGMALGITMMLPEEDHLNYTKSQLLARIKVMLGGRVAEEIIFGENNITTGAQNDLERATDLLRKMITKFGMSKKLGPLTFGQSNEQVFLGRDFGSVKNYSEKIASEIDAEMKSIIDMLQEEVRALLTSKRKHMDALAGVILKEETIDKEGFAKIIRDVDSGSFKIEV